MKKMKLVISACFLFCSLSIFAQDSRITITSFGTVEPRVPGHPINRTAEVCGVVSSNGPTIAQLEIIADYNTNNPGYYTTTVAANGRFCKLIQTFVGHVMARELVGPSTPVPSITQDVASFSDHKMRSLE